MSAVESVIRSMEVRREEVRICLAELDAAIAGLRRFFPDGQDWFAINPPPRKNTKTFTALILELLATDSPLSDLAIAERIIASNSWVVGKTSVRALVQTTSWHLRKRGVVLGTSKAMSLPEKVQDPSVNTEDAGGEKR